MYVRSVWIEKNCIHLPHTFNPSHDRPLNPKLINSLNLIPHRTTGAIPEQDDTWLPTRHMTQWDIVEVNCMSRCHQHQSTVGVGESWQVHHLLSLARTHTHARSESVRAGRSDGWPGDYRNTACSHFTPEIYCNVPASAVVGKRTHTSSITLFSLVFLLCLAILLSSFSPSLWASPLPLPLHCCLLDDV